MQFNNQPQQKPAPTFGAVQHNFVFKLRTFQINDQFTITEDMPSNKPVRTAMREMRKPIPGKASAYQVFLVRIMANNFEADLELFEDELNSIAVACPKDTKNFKGITLAFDGRKWVYICQSEGNVPISQGQQPQDQKGTFLMFLVQGIKSNKACNIPVNDETLLKIAESITPGKGKELIYAAKFEKGVICQKDGVHYEVVE